MARRTCRSRAPSEKARWWTVLPVECLYRSFMPLESGFHITDGRWAPCRVAVAFAHTAAILPGLMGPGKGGMQLSAIVSRFRRRGNDFLGTVEREDVSGLGRPARHPAASSGGAASGWASDAREHTSCRR